MPKEENLAVKRYEVKVLASNMLTYSVFMEEGEMNSVSALRYIKGNKDRRILDAMFVDVSRYREFPL